MAIAAADKVVHGNDLTYITQQYKSYFQAKETGKGLSTNDYTTSEQTKLSNIEAGAEVNVIEAVKLNGTALTPDANKAVDVKALPLSGGTLTGAISVGEMSGQFLSTEIVIIDSTGVLVDNGLLTTNARTAELLCDKIEFTSGTDAYDLAFPAKDGTIALTSDIPTVSGVYAPLASPDLTGTPTAPTASAGTNTTQVATTAFVTTAISNAMGSVAGLTFNTDYSTYADLAEETGTGGVIYLIPNSGTNPNSYDEYFWDGTGYEKFGTTDVDLSGYVQTSALETLTTTEITTLLNL